MSASVVSQEQNEATVIAYYERLSTRLGYRFALGDERHFGMHPEGQRLRDSQARAAKRAKIATDLGLAAGKHVLDVGCGSGVVSVALARDTGAVVDGISVTPRDIHIARKRAARHYLDNTYRIVNVLDMTILHKYDGAYTTEVLSHVPDIPRALANIYTALKPGARVAFCEYTTLPDEAIEANHELQPLVPLGDIVIAASGLHGVKQVRHNGWPTLLESAGFEDIGIEDITANVLPSIERLKTITTPQRLLFRALGKQEEHPGTLTAAYLPQMCELDVFRYNYITATKPA